MYEFVLVLKMLLMFLIPLNVQEAAKGLLSPTSALATQPVPIVPQPQPRLG